MGPIHDVMLQCSKVSVTRMTPFKIGLADDSILIKMGDLLICNSRKMPEEKTMTSIIK